MKSLKIAAKGYVFYAYDLCKKTKIINELEKSPLPVSQLSKSLGIKNIKMVEAMLDFLVGKNILKYENECYSPTGLIPSPFTKKEQEFIDVKYNGSEDWALFLYEYAENSLYKGSAYAKTGFDDNQAIQLWDSVMTGPLYSLRQIAVGKLLNGLKGNIRIVDYGCGSGTAIVELMEKSSRPLEIVGVDASSKMLSMAKDRVKLVNLGKHKVKLVEKDLSVDFVFESAFDAAFCSILINHIPEKSRDKFFENVSKNLKPGAKFVIFQLVNKNKFERVFSDWLLNVVPTHYGFPFFDDYLKMIKNHFSRVEVLLNGLIVIAYK